LRGSIPQLLRNRPNKDVDVIVVTDGERILGIGDQGAGGLGISIGKLSLYTGIGGIRPERTLPIVLDVGTNNPERLKDPEYLGWRHERITGQAYFDFVDQFVQAVKQEFPETLLQWEDFATPHARPILQRYRDQLLTFNDDIQVTAAVVLGAILGAVKVTGKSLKERPIIFPLSNPTSKSEATAEDLIRWTDGRALVASGSPFAPVDYKGRKITIAQCNNVHIFPAMGLGIVASGARRVTDAMMQAAARALAANSPALKDPSASLLSSLKDSRRVARDIAAAVGTQAQKGGVAPKRTDDELRRRVLETQWTPAYSNLSNGELR
jgi:malic enzyme